jgi:hypothetical protein
MASRDVGRQGCWPAGMMGTVGVILETERRMLEILGRDIGD